jgi:magnesium chelatase family protein
MALARTYSVALVGVEGHLIEIEADIAHGLPATILVGLPDTALREARDRIRAAIVNTGEPWPTTKITVGLSPASLPKRGSGFDLAIAVAILAAAGTVPSEPVSGMLFLAELGLDGQLRPVPGVLPAVAAAAAHGIRTVVIAAGNAAEATQIPNVRVVPALGLSDVTAWLRGGPEPPREHADGRPETKPRPGLARPADLADLRGQDEARAAAEICAAGGHNLSLLGPPGAGTTMLAERIPTILPGLDRAAALEVTAIHSVAGVVPEPGIITRPPFCAPHHTASRAAMIGGGSGIIRPGAVSLAHRGILFLDSAPEFSANVLDTLRQPLESGEVIVARGGLLARFPARFSLILAASPCPCTAAGRPPADCGCTPAMRRRYLSRLSGPLTDRIDLKVTMTPPADRTTAARGESSQAVLDRVAAARERAAHRLRGTPWKLNSEIPAAELRRSYPLPPGSVGLLQRAADLGVISERAARRAARVAWSIADLAGRDRPNREDCALALAFLTGTAA